MEVKFILGRVFLFLSYRWNDSFPGTSVRHLSKALISSPSSGNTWGQSQWEWWVEWEVCPEEAF